MNSEEKKNEMIARWMGWTNFGPSWDGSRVLALKPETLGIRTVSEVADYSTDPKALGEVLERIRKQYIVAIEGNPARWILSVRSIEKISPKHPFSFSVFGLSEQAAKFEAVVQFIKSQEGKS